MGERFPEPGARWINTQRGATTYTCQQPRYRPKRFGPELYDGTIAPLSLKFRMLMTDVIETLMYRCVMWTRRAEHFAKL